MKTSSNMDPDSLISVCMQHIEDVYYYGQWGDFKIIIDSRNGFVNATKLCSIGGKVFGEWLKNKQSKSYMDFVKQIHSAGNDGNFNLLYEYKGGRSETANILRGTYVHKDLIVQIACWVSNVFAYKVTEIVHHVLIKKICEEYMKNISTLQTEVTTLANETEKYRQIEEDISPKTKDESKRPIFVLIDIGSELYAMRCQKRSVDSQLKKLQRRHPYAQTAFRRDYYPNAINLFNRVKEKTPNIITYGNRIRLINGYTRAEFIDDIKRIADEKM